tara:strand:+ start:1386 stop:2768 length:1383 start_codon:yes stop_codon:yes gene_type:complete
MVNNTSKKIFFYFLIGHLLIWTLVPSLSNNNLPRDTIEALAWGSNLDWGFEKHPPLSAFAAEVFYQIFGNQDWAYYFLSQIFVVSAFFIVWIFSKEFFKNQTYALISLLLLEGIYFYNFTTPEFNVNVCQLPFWSLSVLYAWRGFKDNKNSDWLLLGLFAALGILSKYLFIYLLLAMDVFFCYMIIRKKVNFKSVISLIPLFLVLLPHLIWLTENNYATITYGLHRSTGDFYAGDSEMLNHVKYPLLFLAKQIAILVPFFIMLLFITPRLKTKFNFKDERLVFLLTINILPLIFIFLTSLFFGVKIRTMWMTPFYLFFGVLIVYILQKNIDIKKIKRFSIVFLVFFILSPSLYFLNSKIKKDQRLDYRAEEISREVQKNWNKNFKNDIKIVIGQAWWAGNLSYHLESRPKYIRGYLNFVKEEINPKDGVVYIGDKSMLAKSCPGALFVIHSRYICMVGSK